MKRALIAGSFDPVTAGHMDIIKRALEIFDEVHAVIFINSEKKYMFTLDNRIAMLEEACKGLENLKTGCCDGLLADYMKKNGISAVVKGVRNSSDYTYEHEMALINRSLWEGAETVFLPAKQEYRHISSAMVRELIKYGRDISMFVPSGVGEYIASLNR